MRILRGAMRGFERLVHGVLASTPKNIFCPVYTLAVVSVSLSLFMLFLRPSPDYRSIHAYRQDGLDVQDEYDHLTSEQVRCYLKRYVDLDGAFGDNIKMGRQHWVLHGRGEGRTARCPTHKAHAWNKSFVRASTSTPTYFVMNEEVFHVLQCNPCGPSTSVCDGSIPVTLVHEKDLKSLYLGKEVFNCELMAPWLWEGNNFIRNRKPLRIRINNNLPMHINILMCGMGKDFTGGPLSIMHFANEMIKQGHKVRWVNVDGEGLKGEAFLGHATKYANLEYFTKEVEFVYGARRVVNPPLECNENDIFMATIYFTAQIAHFTAQAYPFKQKNFIYFIQDFEPIFFPHDSNYMEAMESYRLPHFAIYSTPFLQKWFVQARYGQVAFMMSPQLIDTASFAAEPAMKRWPKLDVAALTKPNRTRILIVYTRSHADRNAYTLTVDGLSSAVCAGAFTGKWKFIGVGSLRDYTLVLGSQCGKSMPLDIRKNIPEPEYLELLRTGDVGYSLMISPHPSLPPFDLAAAGLITVTNAFNSKTEDMFLKVSSNFVVVQPYIEDIVAGLRRAAYLSKNATLRQIGAESFSWESRWDGPKCYGQPLANKIKEWVNMTSALW